MKIKKEFWELIKSGEKTIELRRINKLRDLLYGTNGNIDLDGRFEIGLHDDKECQGHNEIKGHSESYCFASDCYCYKNGCKLGIIKINGYQVIKNPFNDNYSNLSVLSDLKNIIGIDNLGTNIEWISDNWKWLKEYFKDDPEILVLKIEI